MYRALTLRMIFYIFAFIHDKRGAYDAHSDFKYSLFPATPRTFAWRQARGGTANRMAGAVLCSEPETGSRTVAAYAGHRGAPLLKLPVQSVKRAAQWVQTGV